MLTGLLITVDAVWADINIIADDNCSAVTGLLITVDAVWADINIIADVDCSAECPTELLVSIIDGFHQIYKRRETGITILSEASLKYYFFERIVYKNSRRQIFEADNDILAYVTFLLKIDISEERLQDRYTKHMYKLCF
jgi:hypothetical protein